MSDLQTKSFTTIVQDYAAAVQGYSSRLVDFTIGSVLRALSEAQAACVLWLQGMILQVLAKTRAATSNGADLDSFVADFGLTRLPASFATGQETFSRFTPTQQAVVPIGALVQTGDGSQQFAVELDSTNAAYSAALGGYVLAPGVASVTAPVIALTAGTAANVVSGSISALAQAIPGVDTVTNAAALTSGVDAETDPALRARFISYLKSLSKATKAAIVYAILSLQQGITETLTENQTKAGVYQPGYFFAVIDDGSGAPPDSLVSTVYNAIDLVRPFTVTFDVFKPNVVSASIVMTIATAAGYTHSAVVAVVIAALQNFINTLPRDSTTQIMLLPYSKLAQVAYDSSPGVTNVTGVTLNGGVADISASAQQTIKAATLTVN
jgi:hypothetical protein